MRETPVLIILEINTRAQWRRIYSRDIDQGTFWSASPTFGDKGRWNNKICKSYGCLIWRMLVHVSRTVTKFNPRSEIQTVTRARKLHPASKAHAWCVKSVACEVNSALKRVTVDIEFWCPSHQFILYACYILLLIYSTARINASTRAGTGRARGRVTHRW